MRIDATKPSNDVEHNKIIFNSNFTSSAREDSLAFSEFYFFKGFDDDGSPQGRQTACLADVRARI